MGSGVLSPELFGGGGDRRREHHTPRRGGAHSPREVGSVSQHRRRMAAGRRRVVGAVFARSFAGVTLNDVAALEIDSREEVVNL